MQNNRWLQALIVLLVIIASAWLIAEVWSFLIQFSNVFLLFFLAWLLAFILRPIARWLSTRGMPYLLAVGVVYLSLAVVFAVAGFLLVPVITDQTQQLSNNFGVYTNQMYRLVVDGEATLKSWGVKDVDLKQFYQQVAAQAQNVVPQVLQNTLSVLQSVATLALQVILVFILSFYFMKDGDRLFGNMANMLPPRWQEEVRLVALSIEKSFGGFIRGQLVFALVYALLNAIVMLLPPFRLEYVLIASIVAGLCMIIPLVGNFLAFVPALLVCIVTGKASLWLWLLLALFIMQSLMMNFLGPRIMSSAIGIHPLYVMAALLIGGQVGGLWGGLFGIPIAGAINLIGRPLLRRLRYQMPLYQEGTHSLTTSAFVTGPLASSLNASRPQGATPSVVSERVETPEEREAAAPRPHAVSASVASLPKELELDDDFVVHPAPTLTARAWRLIFYLGSRARIWAGKRLQARASRQ